MPEFSLFWVPNELRLSFSKILFDNIVNLELDNQLLKLMMELKHSEMPFDTQTTSPPTVFTRAYLNHNFLFLPFCSFNV